MSLIMRARAQDPQAWEKLATLFGPLVYGWARKAGLQADDAADIVQEVFISVSKHIAGFRRDRPGDSFRAWLRTICKHKLMDHFRKRKAQPLAFGGSTDHINPRQPEIPQLPAEDYEDRNEVCRLRKRMLEIARDGFRDDIWQAFWRTAVEGDAPNDVAEDLNVSVWFVYKAKSRVLQRLRLELDDLPSQENPTGSAS